MIFKEANEYIEKIKDFGINPGLTIIAELLRRLGKPHEQLQFVHLAGTNGKGSALNFISGILKAAGYRTGRFFSPAISVYRERIQINNRMISKKDFCRLLDIIKDAAGSMEADGFSHPTSFEVDTALAFLYFAEKKCDLAVIETGLGGTYDATNIIKKTLISVITPISMDHMDFLGRSITEIAGHKAGIIKENSLVVCASQQDEVYPVIAKKAHDCGSILMKSPLGKVSRCRYPKPDINNHSFRQYFNYGELDDLEINMAGEHQIGNAVLAIDTVKALTAKGYKISESHIRKGLREAYWPGRFEIISSKPLFIIDGAHNADSASKLAQTLKMYFTNKRIIYIMGVLCDKEYPQIIANTYELAEHIITVRPPDKRALSAYELAVEVSKVHPKATGADSLAEACELSVLLAGKDGMVVAFGSFTFLGGIKDILKKLSERRGV